MSTLAIKLRYRPLRLGWCVSSGDFDAYRRAARMSFTMWGGRFNPIIPVDQPDLAHALVKLFRVDMLVPLLPTDDVQKFVDSYKHLPWPFMNKGLFTERYGGGIAPLVVDISHPITQIYNELYKNNPSPQSSIDLYEWDEADPLADIFLALYGAVPPATETGADYLGALQVQLFGQKMLIQNGQPVPPRSLGKETIATLNRAFIDTHFVVRNYRDHPGFYIGEADNFSDLVNYWNLRATGAQLLFYDPRYADRLKAPTDQWIAQVRQAPKPKFRPEGVALWHRQERSIDGDRERFGDGLALCGVSQPIWNGLNLQAPFVYFSQHSALASLSEANGTTVVSFPMSAKPFVDDLDASDQHYVLSVDPGIGLFRNERATLFTPFIPELNEYYGRNNQRIHTKSNSRRTYFPSRV